jgi:hypothetical protein
MIKAMPKRILAVKLDATPQSKTLIIPDSARRKSGILMQVTHVGEKVCDVEVGNIIVVHPEWYGAIVRVENDAGEVTEYCTVAFDDILMIQNEA